MVPAACSNPGVAGGADRSAMAGPRMLPDASGIGPSAIPQGSMDGSDLAGAAGCEDTHRSTPLPEPSGGGVACIRPSGPSGTGRADRGSARRLRAIGCAVMAV